MKLKLIKNLIGNVITKTKSDDDHQIDLARTLRKNALGLEYNYGLTQFVKRVRAAADAIEDMENTLLAIMLNSQDQWAKETAEEALDRLRERNI